MSNHFQHQHTAHCESGVSSTLLRNHGLDIDEALVFGIAHALTFAYFPFQKVSGMPLIGYRMPPGWIFKNTFKQLGIPLQMTRFSSESEGMAALDEAIAKKELVALQTSVFWLPYFPEELRFHFNAHNILIYGKEQDEYLISDPVFETPMRASSADLIQARFAKGAFDNRGLMYRIDTSAIPQEIDYKKIINHAIKKTTKMMRAPIPVVGFRGMKLLANAIEKLPRSKKTDRYKKAFLGHIIRMQEEIGTGGAGFRFMYAYFLEQAAEHCNCPEFKKVSQELTEIGDFWRLFASDLVKQIRTGDEAGYARLATSLRQIAEMERQLWHRLGQVNKENSRDS